MLLAFRSLFESSSNRFAAGQHTTSGAVQASVVATRVKAASLGAFAIVVETASATVRIRATATALTTVTAIAAGKVQGRAAGAMTLAVAAATAVGKVQGRAVGAMTLAAAAATAAGKVQGRAVGAMTLAAANQSAHGSPVIAAGVIETLARVAVEASLHSRVASLSTQHPASATQTATGVALPVIIASSHPVHANSSAVALGALALRITAPAVNGPVQASAFARASIAGRGVHALFAAQQHAVADAPSASPEPVRLTARAGRLRLAGRAHVNAFDVRAPRERITGHTPRAEISGRQSRRRMIA